MKQIFHNLSSISLRPYSTVLGIILITSFSIFAKEPNSSDFQSTDSQELSSKREKNKYQLGVNIEPEIQFSPNGPLNQISENGTFEQNISSAKITLKLKPNEIHPFGLDLGYDFADPELKNAFLYFEMKDLLTIKTGRFKIPFGLDFQRSSSDIAFHDRSKSYSIVKNTTNSSRHNGLQVAGETPFGQSISLSFFQGSNVNSELSGLEIIQTTSVEFIQRIQDYRFGAAWLSDPIKLYENEYYRSNFYSAWASYSPDKIRLEAERVWFDPNVSLYTRTMGEFDDQELNSTRAMAEYTFRISKHFALAPMTQYERIEIKSGSKDYFRNGLWLQFLNKKKAPKVSLSFNNLMKYNEITEAWEWEQIGFQFLYKLSTKGEF